jgi:hypothetical protein
MGWMIGGKPKSVKQFPGLRGAKGQEKGVYPEKKSQEMKKSLYSKEILC